MIYDLRTYTLKPGSVPAYEKFFGEALAVREQYSRLGGFWHTEVGTLNQVIHIWPYDSLAHIESTRKALAADTSGRWPPGGGDMIVSMESELLASTPWMREWTEPQRLGNYYELRTYTYMPGTIGEVVKRWEKAAIAREKYSPLAGLWTNASNLNKLYHMWPYDSLDDRIRLRADSAAKEEHWPPQPSTTGWMLRQENKVLIPAEFSPMH